MVSRWLLALVCFGLSVSGLSLVGDPQLGMWVTDGASGIHNVGSVSSAILKRHPGPPRC